jgi:hypothetical protein
VIDAKEDLRALYDAAVTQRDSYRSALDLIVEDGQAWLDSQCDETCCEMIKLIVKYAQACSGGAKP